MNSLTNGASKPESSTQRRLSIQQTIQQVFSCPLFLALIICYSLALILNVFGFFQSPINELLSILNYIGSEFYLLPGLVKAGFSILVISLVAGVLTVTALWCIYLNTKNAADTHVYRISFTAIQVVKFNYLIISSVILLLGGMGTVIQLGKLGEAFTQARVLQISLIVAFFVAVYFNFEVLLAFSLMKETACEKIPIKQVSPFVAVVSMLLGVVLIGLLVSFLSNLSELLQTLGLSDFVQLPWTMILAIILSGVSSILFGIYLFVYRVKIGQLD